jgi:hypothetical protein
VFGLPAWARLPTLDLEQIFPCVPIQIMDACLKGILQVSTPTNQFLTPAPGQTPVAASQTWLPRIQRFLPHSWIDSALVTKKAVKRDDAGAPTQLWDQRCTLVFPHVSSALESLRHMLVRVLASHNMVDKFRAYLTETYGADWLALLHQGREREAHRHSLPQQKRSWGVEKEKALYDELLKDVIAGTDAIARFADSDWWSWKQGSASLFWRWPKGEQQSFPRDGMPPWIKTRLP